MSIFKKHDKVERSATLLLILSFIVVTVGGLVSKRTGPDLARVGGRYSDKWHRQHLIDPRSVVPESVMPGYPFLAKTELKFDDIADHLKALRTLGVPYTDDMIQNAKADLVAQATGEETDGLIKRYTDDMIQNAKADLVAQATGEETDGLIKRYGKEVFGSATEVKARDFDGNPKKITEMDALIAYLQMLGTLVDFKTFDESNVENLRYRRLQDLR